MEVTSTMLTEEDHGYPELEHTIRKNISELVGPVFVTDVDPDRLWDAYLNGIPASARQHYSCHSCRRFIQRYGGLATVNDRWD